MSLAHLNTVTVDCELVTLDGGTPQAGSVTFTPPETLFDVVGNQVITPTPIVRQLGDEGESLIDVPACDDPDVTTLGGNDWAYTVTIDMRQVKRQTFQNVRVLVADAGTTINLAELLLGSVTRSVDNGDGTVTLTAVDNGDGTVTITT